MKKNIFNGKIKKEYFSYVLGYMIFFVLLFIGVGALCIYVSIWGMASSTLGGRLLVAAFSLIAFILAFVYLLLELLVVRRFPKYKKLRRILFNSDIYFTDSNSKEYYGKNRGIRGRRHKVAFDLVTSFAEVEKGMGRKKPIQYKIYAALAAVMALLGLVILIVAPILFGNGAILPKLSDGNFAVCCIFVAVICIVLAVFFLVRALKVGIMAPYEKIKWAFELHASLADIAVRKNNKKLKYWYNKDQLEQIENLVRSASDNAELKLEPKGNNLVSFTVIDTLNDGVRFTGYFI